MKPSTPTQPPKCPTCGSLYRISRAHSHCVMTCPPERWRWVKDERRGCLDADQIECADPWHDVVEAQPVVQEYIVVPEWVIDLKGKQ